MLKKLRNMGKCSYYIIVQKQNVHHSHRSSLYMYKYYVYTFSPTVSMPKCIITIWMQRMYLKKNYHERVTQASLQSARLTTLQEAPVFSMTQIEWGGEIASHNGSSTSCPPNQHVADEWPAISINIIHLGTSQSVGAVEASNEINLPIIHSNSWPRSWLVHRPQGCPLVCNSIVPIKES